jgi:hypothetical protein
MSKDVSKVLHGSPQLFPRSWKIVDDVWSIRDKRRTCHNCNELECRLTSVRKELNTLESRMASMQRELTVATNGALELARQQQERSDDDSFDAERVVLWACRSLAFMLGFQLQIIAC